MVLARRDTRFMLQPTVEGVHRAALAVHSHSADDGFRCWHLFQDEYGGVPWSFARIHLDGRDDFDCHGAPVLRAVGPRHPPAEGSCYRSRGR